MLGPLGSLVKGLFYCSSGHLGLQLIDQINYPIVDPLRVNLHHAEHLSFELADQFLCPIYLRSWWGLPSLMAKTGVVIFL